MQSPASENPPPRESSAHFRRRPRLRDTAAWMGIVLLGFIVLGTALKRLGHLALDWIERRMTPRQKMAATAALLLIVAVLAVLGLVQFYGR